MPLRISTFRFKYRLGQISRGSAPDCVPTRSITSVRTSNEITVQSNGGELTDSCLRVISRTAVPSHIVKQVFNDLNFKIRVMYAQQIKR